MQEGSAGPELCGVPRRTLPDKPTRLALQLRSHLCAAENRRVARVGTGQCGGKPPVKSTRIERRAQKLQLATGLPWSTSLSRVRNLAPSDPLIPPADAQQAELECYFLYHMAWPGIDTRHPWGIRSVDSHRDRMCLTVENDVKQVVSGESMASELVRACLPRLSGGFQVQ